MRNISFALTTPRFLDGSKTVTRRLGWTNISAGDVLCAVEKSQGLKKGERVKRLGVIRVKSATRQCLNFISEDDVRREGFPNMTPSEFVEFFCKTHRPCQPDWKITRIEFVREPLAAPSPKASEKEGG